MSDCGVLSLTVNHMGDPIVNGGLSGPDILQIVTRQSPQPPTTGWVVIVKPMPGNPDVKGTYLCLPASPAYESSRDG